MRKGYKYWNPRKIVVLFMLFIPSTTHISELLDIQGKMIDLTSPQNVHPWAETSQTKWQMRLSRILIDWLFAEKKTKKVFRTGFKIYFSSNLASAAAQQIFTMEINTFAVKYKVKVSLISLLFAELFAAALCSVQESAAVASLSHFIIPPLVPLLGCRQCPRRGDGDGGDCPCQISFHPGEIWSLIQIQMKSYHHQMIQKSVHNSFPFARNLKPSNLCIQKICFVYLSRPRSISLSCS